MRGDFYTLIDKITIFYVKTGILLYNLQHINIVSV